MPLIVFLILATVSALAYGAYVARVYGTQKLREENDALEIRIALHNAMTKRYPL